MSRLGLSGPSGPLPLHDRALSSQNSLSASLVLSRSGGLNGPLNSGGLASGAGSVPQQQQQQQQQHHSRAVGADDVARRAVLQVRSLLRVTSLYTCQRTAREGAAR